MSIKDGKDGEFKPIGDHPFFKLGDDVKESNVKDTNPKDAIGVTKTPMSTVPCGPIMEAGLGMLEGSVKYGRHNYRVAGVRASIYYDAAMRHLMAWWEGQDTDPDSGIHHIGKAISTLIVLRDAQMNEMVTDDRPIGMRNPDWLKELNEQTKALLEKYPNPKAPFLSKDYVFEEGEKNDLETS